jgi:hypothetical protein
MLGECPIFNDMAVPFDRESFISELVRQAIEEHPNISAESLRTTASTLADAIANKTLTQQLAIRAFAGAVTRKSQEIEQQNSLTIRLQEDLRSSREAEPTVESVFSTPPPAPVAAPEETPRVLYVPEEEVVPVQRRYTKAEDAFLEERAADVRALLGKRKDISEEAAIRTVLTPYFKQATERRIENLRAGLKRALPKLLAPRMTPRA